MVLEANYIGNVGRNLGGSVDYNTSTGDLFDGRPDRLNPTFGGINYRAMLAHSAYHAGQFQLNKRLSKGFTGQFSYTYGKAMDSGSDVQVGANPVDAHNLEPRMAAADFDVRHRLVANWLLGDSLPRETRPGVKHSLLGGWQVNGVIQFQSGYPFTVNTNAPYPTGDYNGDGVNNDRPNTAGLRSDAAGHEPGGAINGASSRPTDFRARRSSATCRATPTAVRTTRRWTCRSSRTSRCRWARRRRSSSAPRRSTCSCSANLDRPIGNLGERHLRPIDEVVPGAGRSSSR